MTNSSEIVEDDLLLPVRIDPARSIVLLQAQLSLP
jgi:hypothetical protein